MLIRIFDAVVESEILHTARTTSAREKFQKLFTTLLTRKYKQGCQNLIKTPLQ